jgi:hypothetical protein
MLAKQEERASTAEAAMQKRVNDEKAQKLADYIKKVTEVDKKITPAELKEKWQPLLESNFEATSKIIDGMQVHPSARTKAAENKAGANDTGEKTTSLKNYVDHKESFDSAAVAAFTAPSTN